MLVLIVDDTADVRFLLNATLALQGIDSANAGGGPEALARLESGLRPDVILLDVQMPDMDGWQTLEAIRTNSDTAELPVIMCTVKSRPEDVVRGWELGCDGYIAKPFDLDHLVDVLQTVAARLPAQRETARKSELALLRVRRSR